MEGTQSVAQRNLANYGLLSSSLGVSEADFSLWMSLLGTIPLTGILPIDPEESGLLKPQGQVQRQKVKYRKQERRKSQNTVVNLIFSVLTSLTQSLWSTWCKLIFVFLGELFESQCG